MTRNLGPIRRPRITLLELLRQRAGGLITEETQGGGRRRARQRTIDNPDALAREIERRGAVTVLSAEDGNAAVSVQEAEHASTFYLY